MQYRKYHLWPWENEVGGRTEFISSLDSLKRFLKIADIDQLQTLEDVSAIASLVGHDLAVIALTKGQATEERIGNLMPGRSDLLESTQKIYTFRTMLPERELRVSVKENQATLTKYASVGFQRYLHEEMKVGLPTDSDIAIGNVPNVDEEKVYAFDLRGLMKVRCYPTTAPYSSEIQQGFMRILRDCVSDLVRTLLP